MNEHSQLDALGLAHLIRSGALSATELAADTRTRIESLNPSLNAVVRLYDEAHIARAIAVAPDGPFTGVPFLLKDLLAGERGQLLTSGSRVLASFRAAHDTQMVERLRRTGLIIIGRTNTPEFGMMVTTEPVLFGPCRNPLDPDHTPGGSSGGAAAAVASAMVPMAHASDGGGSIRIPASCCGVFGFKPSRGVNPLEPEYTDLLGGLTAEHAITRSVRDSAALLAATGRLQGAPTDLDDLLDVLDHPPPRLRIRVLDRLWSTKDPHPDVQAVLEETITRCEDLGHLVTPGDLPGSDRATVDAFASFSFAQAHQTLQTLGQLRGHPIEPGEVEPLTWSLADRGSYLNTISRFTAIHHLESAAAAVRASFSDFDVLLTPTLAAPPLPIGVLHGGRDDLDALLEEKRDFAPNTALFNVTGQPAMSVPVGMSREGLPIGMQFVAPALEDLLLMRLARSLEVRGWMG